MHLNQLSLPSNIYKKILILIGLKALMVLEYLLIILVFQMKKKPLNFILILKIQ
jgi:hypothetical protein